MTPWNLLLRILVGLAGAWLIGVTLSAAVRSYVLPRSERVYLTRQIFRWTYTVGFRWRLKKAKTFQQVDQLMALFAPVALLINPIVWMALLILGYAGLFWAVGPAGRTFWEAIVLSGSSLLTLGYEKPVTRLGILLSFSEAGIGLGIVALLIAYLPTMYAAFSKREAAVTMLAVRAGSPPSAVEMIQRVHRIRGLDYMGQLWEDWENFFAELEESHSSLAALVFFRSPNPDRHWLTASGVVMDAAALISAAVDTPFDPRANLCIRAGFLALRQIANFFEIAHNPDPHFPRDPISVSREEFDEAVAALAVAGVPVKADLDQAWADFAGWRVNYDRVLLALAGITNAPVVNWISDRSPAGDQHEIFV